MNVDDNDLHTNKLKKYQWKMRKVLSISVLPQRWYVNNIQLWFDRLVLSTFLAVTSSRYPKHSGAHVLDEVGLFGITWIWYVLRPRVDLGGTCNRTDPAVGPLKPSLLCRRYISPPLLCQHSPSTPVSPPGTLPGDIIPSLVYLGESVRENTKH